MRAGTVTPSSTCTDRSPNVATCFAVTMLTRSPDTATIVPAPVPRSRSVRAVTMTPPSFERSTAAAVAGAAGNANEPIVSTAASTIFKRTSVPFRRQCVYRPKRIRVIRPMLQAFPTYCARDRPTPQRGPSDV